MSEKYTNESFPRPAESSKDEDALVMAPGGSLFRIDSNIATVILANFILPCEVGARKRNFDYE
jgi:hypothetical protein